MGDPVGEARVATFRAEYARIVATLVGAFGDLDLAEEVIADAFAVAVDRWPRDGIPQRPGAWVTTTARHRALDVIRREASRHDRHRQALALRSAPRAPDTGPVVDDRLRLVFTCCHPALAPAARVALTLRLLGGLSTAQIAHAFLVPEATMAQRLVRAKRKVAAARIPYRVPASAELPSRLPAVLAVVYLVFTEGHAASDGATPVRTELCAEAVRLGRLLVELMPGEPEVLGLLALLLLTDARRPARAGPDGAAVLLADQDRSRWNRAQIAEGHALVRDCLRRGAPGPYQLQAAIAAVHADARTAAATDWAQILVLYDQLLALTPTPVVALNRAVALAEVAGPAAALRVVDALELPRYHLHAVTRASLLARLGRVDEAAVAWSQAAALAGNAADRALLTARADRARRKA